jgi:hypothetical protein
MQSQGILIFEKFDLRNMSRTRVKLDGNASLGGVQTPEEVLLDSHSLYAAPEPVN